MKSLHDSSRPNEGRPRETVELTVPGAPPVPLLFVEADARLYVLPANPPGSWFAAAAREGQVVTRMPDGSRRTSPVRVRDDRSLLTHLESLFETKYGPEVWRLYFAGTRSALEIALDEEIVFRDGVARIRGEFDAAAEAYDARLDQNPIERYLKDRVAELALRALDGFDPILEIGPGTGYHTVALLAAGHRVTVVDISEAMLHRLEERVTAAGWQDRLEVRRGFAADLERVTERDDDASFGAVFSAFGALDLEARVDGLVRAADRIVRPGGRFVLTSLNRPGWVPLLWDLALVRPSAAGSRMGAIIPAGGVRYPLTLYPRAPSDWDRLLSPSFRRLSLAGVSVLAPPFDAHRPLQFFGTRGTKRLRRWDRWLTERRPAWAASEWLFLTYRRHAEPFLPQAAAAVSGFHEGLVSDLGPVGYAVPTGPPGV